MLNQNSNAEPKFQCSPKSQCLPETSMLQRYFNAPPRLQGIRVKLYWCSYTIIKIAVANETQDRYHSIPPCLRPVPATSEAGRHPIWSTVSDRTENLGKRPLWQDSQDFSDFLVLHRLPWPAGSVRGFSPLPLPPPLPLAPLPRLLPTAWDSSGGFPPGPPGCSTHFRFCGGSLLGLCAVEFTWVSSPSPKGGPGVLPAPDWCAGRGGVETVSGGSLWVVGEDGANGCTGVGGAISGPL